MTGTRADYGHLFWLLKEIDADPDLELQLVVTGAHLSAKWGNTVETIERDGLPIAARVPFDLSDDSPLAIADSLAHSTSGLAHCFDRLKPDIVVVLGDRYEVLAAAQASLMLGIPLAHLHGGETTEGAFDEAIRHAVTKMAHLHFVAADEYAWRVRQLGESDEHIFNFGAPGLDHLTRSSIAGRDELERVIGAPLGSPLFAVTYHPETLDADEGIDGLRAMLMALSGAESASIVFTGVNADPGHDHLTNEIHAFVSADPARRHLIASIHHCPVGRVNRPQALARRGGRGENVASWPTPPCRDPFAHVHDNGVHTESSHGYDRGETLLGHSVEARGAEGTDRNDPPVDTAVVQHHPHDRPGTNTVHGGGNDVVKDLLNPRHVGDDPGDEGNGQSLTADLKSDSRESCSQVNSGRLRPKWPYAAVFL